MKFFFFFLFFLEMTGVDMKPAKNHPQETNRHPDDEVTEDEVDVHQTLHESASPSSHNERSDNNEVENSFLGQVSTPQTRTKGKRPREDHRQSTTSSSTGEGSTSWAALALLVVAVLYCR